MMFHDCPSFRLNKLLVLALREFFPRQMRRRLPGFDIRVATA